MPGLDAGRQVADLSQCGGHRGEGRRDRFGHKESQTLKKNRAHKNPDPPFSRTLEETLTVESLIEEARCYLDHFDAIFQRLNGVCR